MTLPRHLLLLGAALATLGTAACSTHGAPATSPVPVRSPEAAHNATATVSPLLENVVDTRLGAEVGFDEVVERAARAEVVYFGELHDDIGTHHLQLALLEGVARQRGGVILSLEMFERDVQPLLDDYLADRIPEEEFLARARPWPNYAADYGPLVVFAKSRGWPVLAANVPRPIAAKVARGGLEVLDSLPAAEREMAAREYSCPQDRYHERFVATMGTHPGVDDAILTRFYQAQCIKDETMAESIVAALAEHPGALVLHMNGSFHSDYGDGVPARVARRRPGSLTLILSGIPVTESDPLPLAEGRERADYLLYTRRP